MDTRAHIRLLSPHHVAWKAGEVVEIQLHYHIRDEDHACIHMFATEVMRLVECVAVLLDVEPIVAMPDETNCLKLLVRIMYILRSGDDAVRRLRLLQDLLRRHHDAYLRLYPDCLKPKLHWLLHVVLCIMLHRVNLSCFTGERLHITTKRIARNAFRNMAGTVTDRVLADWVSKVNAPTSVEPSFFASAEREANASHLDLLRGAGADLRGYAPARRRGRREAAPAGDREAAPAVLQGSSLRTPQGRLTKGDLLVYRQRGSGRLAAGFATSFFRLRLSPPMSQYVVLLQELVPMARPGHWQRDGARNQVVQVADVMDACAYFAPDAHSVAVILFEDRLWD